MSGENVLDLRGRSLQEINCDDIPKNTETVLLANNDITHLPGDLFGKAVQIWRIDARYNKLKDLKALTTFRALESLDLRNNDLEIDEILDLRALHTIFLRLNGNGFEKYTSKFPLVIPGLLKRAWVIDGEFITDFTKKQAKEFKKTMKFAEIILAARRQKMSELQMAGVSNTAHTFLAGTSCKFSDPGIHTHPLGSELLGMTKREQIERLKFLRAKFPFPLPESRPIDKLALICGILAHHWLGVPVARVVRIISLEYWALVGSLLDGIEHWQEFIILYDLVTQYQPSDPVQTTLWKSLSVEKYVQTGAPPAIGATPRLLLCAILGEADATVPDFKVYKRLKTFLSCAPSEDVLVNAEREILDDVPHEMRRIPAPGDAAAVTHPITGKWISSRVSVVKKGRVYIKISNDIYMQLPVSAFYWDGRGSWREIASTSAGKKAKTATARTFLTIAEALGDTESERVDVNHFAVPLPPNAVRQRNVTPANRDFFLRTSQSRMGTSPFVDKTAKPVERTASFRGIVDPVRPKTSLKRSPQSSRRPNLVIQGVVNVVFGDEAYPGRRIRRFHVKLQNPNSKKVSYVWINEDEIPDEDAARLIDLYKQQIESKMIIVPGL